MGEIYHASIKNHLVDIAHNINHFFDIFHDHDGFYELLFVIKGSSVNNVNGEVQIIKSPTVTYLRPDDVHRITPLSDSTNTYEFFNIKIPTQLMENEFEHNSELKLKLKINVPKLPLNISIGASEAGVLTEQWIEYKKITDINAKEYVYASLIKFMLTLVLTKQNSGDGNIPQWFTELLGKTSSENIQNADYDFMLKNSNVSKSQLWKTFIKHLGMKPTEYINLLRLEHAYESIINTDLPLLDIAYSVNFSNYSYFVRLFKNKYHIYPKDLRKKILMERRTLRK